MNNQNNNSNSKRNNFYIILWIVIVMVLLLGFQYFLMVKIYRENAYQTGNVLVEQIENNIKTNEKKEQELVETLKENYITKAKAVSYIIEKEPEAENDIDELIHIANLMSVDEIHLFDEKGKIYFGTVPKYYGYSFYSGEQMAYFKPMLRDKSLCMAQDVIPNTAENKSMMYAICWSESGERMVQIGVDMARLQEEIKTHDISDVINELPINTGTNVIVADSGTDKILGSTITSAENHSLSEFDLKPSTGELMAILNYTADLNGDEVYCSAQKTDQYFIIVMQSRKIVNAAISTALIVVFCYLTLAALLICFIVWRMNQRILNEKRNANTDAMTGLLNRRAFNDEAMSVDENPRKNEITFIACDINGLKKTNDTYGHEVGDEMILGFSRIFTDCLSQYGNLYRIGGDEFCGILFVSDEDLDRALDDIQTRMKAWSVENGKNLTMSTGHTGMKEFPEASFYDVIKITDKRMYDAKAAFYAGSRK